MAKTVRYYQPGESINDTVFNRPIGDLAENQLGELPPNNALDDNVPTGEYSINASTTNLGNLSALGMDADATVHVIEHDSGGYSHIAIGTGNGVPIMAIREGDGAGNYSDWEQVATRTIVNTTAEEEAIIYAIALG